jgi:hypothetical protein
MSSPSKYLPLIGKFVIPAAQNTLRRNYMSIAQTTELRNQQRSGRDGLQQTVVPFAHGSYRDSFIQISKTLNSTASLEDDSRPQQNSQVVPPVISLAELQQRQPIPPQAQTKKPSTWGRGLKLAVFGLLAVTAVALIATAVILTHGVAVLFLAPLVVKPVLTWLTAQLGSTVAAESVFYGANSVIAAGSALGSAEQIKPGITKELGKNLRFFKQPQQKNPDEKPVEANLFLKFDLK